MKFSIDDAKPFQLIGATALANRKQKLLADQMRLGKTVQAIIACDMIKAKKILVICPASVKLSWRNHFRDWSENIQTTQVVYGRKAKINPYCNVVIINYDLLIYLEIFKQFLDMKFAVCILDEAHYLKNPDAQRTIAVLKANAIASKCVYHWPLTGTPILNRPIELFPLLKAMAPEVIDPYNTYNSYGRYYCGGYYDEATGVYIVKGATNKQELSDRLSKEFMLRRTRKMVFGELDKKIFQLIPIPASNKHIETLAAREFKFERSEFEFGYDTMNMEQAELRHELGDSKVKAAIGHAKYLLENEEKLIVFAWHHSVIAELVKGLKKYNPAVHHGKLSPHQKDFAETKFREDPTCRVFIGNYQSAGIGIDLSSASVILAVEFGWVWGEIEQWSDRAFNFVTPLPILVQFCVIEGSLDEHMLRTTIEKKINTDEIIDLDQESQDLFL